MLATSHPGYAAGYFAGTVIGTIVFAWLLRFAYGLWIHRAEKERRALAVRGAHSWTTLAVAGFLLLVRFAGDLVK